MAAMDLDGTETRTSRLVLNASDTAPSKARSAVRAALGADARHDAVELAVSELVTNAVKHAGLALGERIDLRIDVHATCVHVEVQHQGPGFLPSIDAVRRDHEIGGWGLHIVDQLSRRWSVERRAGATLVWFDVA